MKKKVIFYSTGDIFPNNPTGGIKRFVELLNYFLTEYGSSTALMCPVTNAIKEKLCVRNLKGLTISKSKLNRFVFPELDILISNFNRIKKLRKTNYDSIIVFDVPPAIGLVLLGINHITLMIRKDMIGYEIVATKERSFKFYLKLFFQWVCESLCMIKSERIITQCLYDRDVLMKRHPLISSIIRNKTKIQINNVNPSWAKVTEVKIKSGDSFKICFIGNFDNDRKGHDIFLQAATTLVNKYKNIEFLLIGGGLRLQEYKDKYSTPQIHFTGHLSNPIGELCRCNLLVVPSLADSCPNTILEALLNGVPVIGSRAGGIPEILNFDEGLFDLSSSALIQKIEHLLSSPQKIEMLKNLENRRRDELTFNWAERIAEMV